MSTVPILETDPDLKDRSLSLLHTPIRGSEFESEPVEKSCIVQESVSESESESGSGNKP